MMKGRGAVYAAFDYSFYGFGRGHAESVYLIERAEVSKRRQ